MAQYTDGQASPLLENTTEASTPIAYAYAQPQDNAVGSSMPAYNYNAAVDAAPGVYCANGHLLRQFFEARIGQNPHKMPCNVCGNTFDLTINGGYKCQERCEFDCCPNCFRGEQGLLIDGENRPADHWCEHCGTKRPKEKKEKKVKMYSERILQGGRWVKSMAIFAPNTALFVVFMIGRAHNGHHIECKPYYKANIWFWVQLIPIIILSGICVLFGKLPSETN